MPRPRAVTLIFAMGFALRAAVADALPAVGHATPNVRVEDADGALLELRTLGERPVLIVYEDKGSAQQNEPLKRDLARSAEGDRYRGKLALVAVADVSGYDFWPVRGIVKDAIRSESRKHNTVIYCDWSGAFRRALGLNKDASNVVLLDRAGRVLFARAGTLSPAEREALLTLLRTLAR